MYLYKKYIEKNKYVICGSLIFLLLPFLISKKTTSNDLYMQLIAIEGVVSQFDFSGVGGHPIGFVLIGSFFKILNLDPLLIFNFLQPFISSFCFVLLFKIINNVLSPVLSFFISLSAMSSLIIIKAMNQFGAEIFSLASILFLILYALENFILKERFQTKNLLWIILLSWIALVIRNASIFIIIGISGFLFICGKFNKKKHMAIPIIMLIPGIFKSISSVDNNTSIKNIFSNESPNIFLDQIFKHISNLKEIIMPNILYLNRIPIMKFSIGFLCLLFCLYMFFKDYKSKKELNDKKLIGDLFFIIGLSYYFFLSFASAYLRTDSIYSTDWGNIYRVSGFGIIFFLVSFWVYLRYSKILKREIIIYMLIVFCFGKFAYGLRYEFIYGKTRLLFDDYRNTANSVIDYMGQSNNNKLIVYTSGYHQGKNLYYILKYYDMIYSLPFQVENLTDSKYEINNATLFCAVNDLEYFNKNKNNLEKIKNLNGFYIIKS